MSLYQSSQGQGVPVHDTNSIQTQGNDTTHQQHPKQPRKTARKTPAIDKSAFETECLKKQLNIAHTKLQELETELESVKNTNYILGERIKLFEASTNKELFEKYFPSSQNTLSDDVKQKCSRKCCSNQQVQQHHCYTPPPCMMHCCHSNHAGPDLATTVKEISAKVQLLAHDISAMRSEIKRDEPPCTSYPKSSNIPTAPRTVPLSPEITVVETYQVSPGTSARHNMSVSSDSNTIDDNVTGDLSVIPLNFQVLTTQLPQQQGHTQDILEL